MPLNILIVDDSAVMRSIVRRCLGLAGLPIGEIHEAGNGQEGLAKLDSAWVDVVFSDINMPVMNGEEMILALRRNPDTHEVPVVVISTEGSETRIERLERLGVAFIHKPFRPEMVREVVTRLLSGKLQSSSLAEVLKRTAERTFADLAFMLLDEVALGEESGQESPPDYEAEIGFFGPVTGRLAVAAPAGLLAMAASNMLGLDDGEAPSAEQQGDAWRELASVLCGNLVPLLAGPCAVFRLGPPALTRWPRAEAPATAAASATATLTVEGGTVRLSLFVEEQAATP